MGIFGDEYTYEDEKLISNTQRYKMLGNGWTVAVISHIMKNMEK
jgi:DNA (cytosine-5)-methyltransferase 3A